MGAGFKIACLGRKKEGLGRANDLTDPEIRVKEFAACQVAAVISGVGAIRGRVGQNRFRGGIFTGEKERIGKMIEGEGI